MSRTGRMVPFGTRAALGALVLTLLLPTAPSRAAAEEEPPINITADRMEYFSDKEIVIFTGNALAVRGDATLSADNMEVTLGGEGATEEGGSVDKVIATGNVNFRQNVPETGKDRFATGERGVYDAGRSLITLTGQPKVWEGPNVITGKTMKFFIDEHRFVAEGDDETPVGMTVFPKKGEEEKE